MNTKTLTPDLEKLYNDALATLPAGAVHELEGRAPDVDWSKTNVVAGKILERVDTTIKGKARSYLTLETKEGPRSLWNNVQLSELFDKAKPGLHVVVISTGVEKLEGTKTMRLFKVAMVEPSAGSK